MGQEYAHSRVDGGMTTSLELVATGTLTGLVRQELPGVATVAVRGPDDLESAVRGIADDDLLLP